MIKLVTLFDGRSRVLQLIFDQIPVQILKNLSNKFLNTKMFVYKKVSNPWPNDY